jgi:ribosome maturation factor RimP
VLLAEVVGGRTLRVFIDHPGGVTLELNDLRERYALEVSSPGSRRPLTKPAHFVRFVGRRARVRTRGPISDRSQPVPCSGERAGCGDATSFTGELVGATDTEVTLAAADGLVAIPYSDIRRSHLLED